MVSLYHPCAAILLWFIQPWVFQWAMISRLRLVLATLVLVLGSTYIALRWHASVTPALLVHDNEPPPPLPRFVLALIWYPIGTQILRYTHCLAVGSPAFCQFLGLSTPWQCRWFWWSTPTLVFRQGPPPPPTQTRRDNQSSPPSSESSWRQVLQTSLFDLIIMELLCAAVLYLEWYNTLPSGILVLIRILIMGYSTSLFRLILEVPVRYRAQRYGVSVRIIPIYQQPLSSTSPRDFWRFRWSTSVGYHLRCSYYDPWLRRIVLTGDGMVGIVQRLLVTLLPFGFNCVWHITWWSVAMKGQVDWSYLTLLGLYPLMSLGLQDVVQRYCPYPLLRRILLRFILWIGFAQVVETMQFANGAPPSLRDMCRSNLLLPRLPVE